MLGLLVGVYLRFWVYLGSYYCHKKKKKNGIY